MQDYVATFYGGYDHVALRRSHRPHVSWLVVLVGVALLVLVGVVAADVSAFENPPAVVHVTSVGWYAQGGILLNTSAGFTVHPSEAISFTLACSAVCLPWDAASVSAPFTLVSFSVSYSAVQYTNLTVRAPSSGYAGPLDITLEWS